MEKVSPSGGDMLLRALFDFNGDPKKGELCFKKGDIIHCISIKSEIGINVDSNDSTNFSSVVEGTVGDQKGTFPAVYAEPLLHVQLQQTKRSSVIIKRTETSLDLASNYKANLTTPISRRHPTFLQSLHYRAPSQPKQVKIENDLIALLGNELTWTRSVTTKEIENFHQFMFNERQLVKKLSQEKPLWRKYYLTNSQTPATVTPTKKYALEVYYGDYSHPYVGFCTGSETAIDIIRTALPMDVNVVNIEEDFILKLCGYDEYLDPHNIPLKNFTFMQKKINQSLFKDSIIKLEIIKKPTLYCPLETIEDELFNGNPEKFIDLTEETNTSESPVHKEKINAIATSNFKINIVGLEFTHALKMHKYQYYYVNADLYQGEELLASCSTPKKDTSSIVLFELSKQLELRKTIEHFGRDVLYFNDSTDNNATTTFVTIDEQLTFSLKYKELPKACHIQFSLKAIKHNQKQNIFEVRDMGWVNYLVYDYQGYLRSGANNLALWSGSMKASNFLQCVDPSCIIYVDLYTFDVPMKFNLLSPVLRPLPPVPVHGRRRSMSDPIQHVTHSNSKSTNTALALLLDSTYRDNINVKLTPEHKKALWDCKSFLRQSPKALPKFLLSINWIVPSQVVEGLSLMNYWTPIEPVDALGLLSLKFPDPSIRDFAVQCLENIPIEELQDYIPQLVQVLKKEHFHINAVSKFLLRKAMSNIRIAYDLFWYLKAEMEIPENLERYQLSLESLLCGISNSIRQELLKQDELILLCKSLAEAVKGAKADSREAIFRKQLKLVKLNDNVRLPINPCLQVSRLIPEKCRYFNSKTLPLLLTFENADPLGDEIQVIYKLGDNLRKDILITQMIRIADRLWKDDGLDLRITHYRILATGEDSGLIEVVKSAETTSKLQLEAGGATMAFNKKYLLEWIMKQNAYSENGVSPAIENFTRSCAGYSVLTMIFGIGDRHNDNIMVANPSGHMLHIDFGKILGNWETFGGIRRDRAPFVLTSDMVQVMGGKDSENFQLFVNLCCQAYNILRKHANIFVNLFSMMVATGIEELDTSEGVQYIVESLALSKSDDEASAHFKELISQSINSLATQFNFFVHNVAQQSSRKKSVTKSLSEDETPTNTTPTKEGSFLANSAKLITGSVNQIKNRFSADPVATPTESVDENEPNRARSLSGERRRPWFLPTAAEAKKLVGGVLSQSQKVKTTEEKEPLAPASLSVSEPTPARKSSLLTKFKDKAQTFLPNS